VSLEIVEKHLNRPALAMDRAGKHAAVYLPIYERNDVELDAFKASKSGCNARQRLE
jgi:hypothetical protein